MNIGEALNHVHDLKKSIKELDGAIKAADRAEYGKPVMVSASVFVRSAGSVSVALDRDACLKALQDTKAGYEARIAQLQPVIDMANAALKGVLS